MQGGSTRSTPDGSTGIEASFSYKEYGSAMADLLPSARYELAEEIMIRALEVVRFDRPDEVHTFPKGKLELVRVGGMLLGRATCEPGWRWSEHVGAKTGARLCEVEHVCFVISGRSGLRMRDVAGKVL